MILSGESTSSLSKTSTDTVLNLAACGEKKMMCQRQWCSARNCQWMEHHRCQRPQRRGSWGQSAQKRETCRDLVRAQTLGVIDGLVHEAVVDSPVGLGCVKYMREGRGKLNVSGKSMNTRWNAGKECWGHVVEDNLLLGALQFLLESISTFQ